MDISVSTTPAPDVFAEVSLDDESTTPAGTPEASDTTAAPDPDASASAPSDTEPADGQPRDEKGRFTPKEGAPDEAQAPSGEIPDPPHPAPDATPDAAAPEEPPAPPPEPYAVRVAGRPHAIPGATIDPATRRIVVEPEGFEEVNRYLARGIEYHTTGRQQMQQAQAQVARLTEEAGQRNLVADAMLSLADLPEEHLIEAVLEFKAKLPELREQQLKAENDRLKQLLERGVQPGQPAAPALAAPPPEMVQAAVSEAPAVATQHASAMVEALEGLSAEDRADILAIVTENPGRYLRRATEDHAMEYGVEVGAIVFDAGALEAEIQRAARPALRYAAQAKAAAEKADAAKAAAAAAQRNATKLAQPKPSPVAARTGSAPPARGDDDDEPRSFAEWQKKYGI